MKPPVDHDPMRQHYRELSEFEAAQIAEIKEVGRAVYDLLGRIGESRELSIAKQSIEACVMWAVKHITNSNNGSNAA
jgi:hypothetical protein